MLVAVVYWISTSFIFGFLTNFRSFSKFWATEWIWTLFPHFLTISWGCMPILFAFRIIRFWSNDWHWVRTKSKMWIFLASAAACRGVFPSSSYKFIASGSLVRYKENRGISPYSAARCNADLFGNASTLSLIWAPMLSNKSHISKVESMVAIWSNLNPDFSSF